MYIAKASLFDALNYAFIEIGRCNYYNLCELWKIIDVKHKFIHILCSDYLQWNVQIIYMYSMNISCKLKWVEYIHHMPIASKWILCMHRRASHRPYLLIKDGRIINVVNRIPLRIHNFIWLLITIAASTH